jgi:aarF domain-containing kinase
LFIPVAAYKYKTDNGAARTIKFWFHVLPVFIHYRSVQLLNRDLGLLSDEQADPIYEALHERYADYVRDVTYEMRGFFLKNAQLMSTRDDFVPARYMQWLKETQDNLPPVFKGSEARVYLTKMLKEDLGLEFDDVFSSFEEEPLGVASIGQVHRATLRETGAVVAVKMQLPGMEETFRADIRTLRSFCRLALPQHVPAFNEIERQFLTEFDYSREAQNLVNIYRIVMPEWSDFVRVPLPLLDLCSRHILVMEYLDGVKLVDGVRRRFRAVAESRGLVLEELEAERKRQIQAGTYRFRTLAEAAQDTARLRRIQWWYDNFLTANPLRQVFNASQALISRTASALGVEPINQPEWLKNPLELYETPLPMDLGHILSILVKVHAHEIFEGGHFNGDPHPGNILLLRDGKLGLIDYGQVKSMSVEHRIVYAKLIIALGREDKKEVVRLYFDEMHADTKYRNEDVAYRMCCFWNDQDTAEVMQGLNIAEFLDAMEARDPIKQVPEDFLLASRVNLLLRGMGNAFGLKLRMSQLWKDEAEAFLKKHGIDY